MFRESRACECNTDGPRARYADAACVCSDESCPQNPTEAAAWLSELCSDGATILRRDTTDHTAIIMATGFVSWQFVYDQRGALVGASRSSDSCYNACAEERASCARGGIALKRTGASTCILCRGAGSLNNDHPECPIEAACAATAAPLGNTQQVPAPDVPLRGPQVR